MGTSGSGNFCVDTKSGVSGHQCGKTRFRVLSRSSVETPGFRSRHAVSQPMGSRLGSLRVLRHTRLSQRGCRNGHASVTFRGALFALALHDFKHFKHHSPQPSTDTHIHTSTTPKQAQEHTEHVNARAKRRRRGRRCWSRHAAARAPSRGPRARARSGRRPPRRSFERPRVESGGQSTRHSLAERQ